MSTVKSIFSSLGRFLEKARAIMLNLATAFVLIFFLIIIIGGLTSGPEVKDPSGGVLLINPEGVVVDQEGLHQIFHLISLQGLQQIRFKREILYK